MMSFSLISAFDLIPNFDSSMNFTRSDTKTNSFTLIDGILISQRLKDKVSNVRISDYVDNVSDHRPVEMELHATICHIPEKVKVERPIIQWSKLNPNTINDFQSRMSQELDGIQIPFHELLHGDHLCFSPIHVA